MNVKDRVALVTGGAIGTGRAVALALAAATANVVGCDIDGTGIRETAAMAALGRCRSEIVMVDVTVPDQIGRFIRDV